MSDEATNTNGMTEAMLRAYMRKHAVADKKVRDAQSARSALRKSIKAAGEDLKDFDPVYKMNSEEDEQRFLDHIKRQAHLMQLAGFEIGRQISAQLSLEFQGEKENMVGAYALGARANLNGVGEDECPHAQNTVEGQEWMKGWRWSENLANDGDKILDALDAGEDPDAPDAAEGTLSTKTPAKKAGRPKKDAANSAAEAGAAA